MASTSRAVRMRFSALAVAGLLLAGCGSTWEPAPDPRPHAEHAGEIDPRLVWSGWPVGIQGTQGYALEPALDDGYLFVADHRGWIRAIDTESRRTVWHHRLGQPLSAGPAVLDDGLLVIGDRKGNVLTMDARTGEPRWQARLTSEVMAPPRQARGSVIVRSSDGRVYGLDPDNGERQWTYQRSNPPLTLRGDSAPGVAGGNVLVGLSNGRLARLNASTGEVAWEQEVHEPRGATDLERMADITAEPIISRGSVYAVTYQGSVAAFRISSGEREWQRSIGSHYGMALQGDSLYVAADDGRVWSLDRNNGATAWRQSALEGLSLSRPVVVGAYVVIADGEGHVNWLRQRDGELVERQRLSGIGFRKAPVIGDNGQLYLLDRRGRLFVVAPD